MFDTGGERASRRARDIGPERRSCRAVVCRPSLAELATACQRRIMPARPGGRACRGDPTVPIRRVMTGDLCAEDFEIAGEVAPLGHRSAARRGAYPARRLNVTTTRSSAAGGRLYARSSAMSTMRSSCPPTRRRRPASRRSSRTPTPWRADAISAWRKKLE